MANEKRLIDVNAEIKKLKDGFCLNCADYHGILCKTCDIAEAIRILDDAPTVDAVEVVRCKNCRDCEMCYPEKRLDKEATQAWLCKRYKEYRKPDDFCSYGERRD